MTKVLSRVLTRENNILLLTLIALACLPFALRRIVPDAGLSLLLPVILIGTALVWGLARLKIKKIWIGFIFLICGPLVLFALIAQIGNVLVSSYRETLLLLPQAIQWFHSQTPIDPSAALAAQNELATRVVTLSQRVVIWLISVFYGNPIQDPAARAFAWGLTLWLMAAWAGWHVQGFSPQSPQGSSSTGQGRTLIGLLPSTALLGWVLNSTSRNTGILLLHLTVLLILLGLTNYEKLNHIWKETRIDFSDSTHEESLFATIFLTLILITLAYAASSISVEEIREKLREKESVSTTSSSKRGTESDTSSPNPVSGINGDLQGDHLITAGPMLSQEVFMIIATGDLPPLPETVHPNAPNYRWRTMTYQTYTGKGWVNQAVKALDIPANEKLISVNPQAYRLVHQQFSFPGGADGRLYWTGMLVQVDTPSVISWRSKPADQPGNVGFDPLLGADLTGAVTSAENYQADSLLLEPSEADLRAAPASYPAWVVQRYLQLPDSVPERVRALARDLTATESTPYERAVAIENYLRQFPYSLEVPAPPTGRDATDYFIFDLQTGYCDYYATAMTVIARAAGLPARFVIGYASGTYDPVSAHYIVREADAHAWTEIYFPHIGWVEFEPTANQPAPLRLNRGYTLPPPVPTTPLKSMVTEISTFVARLLDMTWRPFGVIGILYVLWLGTEVLRLNLREPSEAIQIMYRRLRRFARPVSGWPPLSQTASEYAANLSAGLATLQNENRLNNWLLTPTRAQIAKLTELYSRSLFSPRPPVRAEAQNAARTWSALWWRLLFLNLLISIKRKSR